MTIDWPVFVYVCVWAFDDGNRCRHVASGCHLEEVGMVIGYLIAHKNGYVPSCGRLV